MRVLHISSGNMYGGVETFLTTLLREASSAPQMKPEFAVCYEGRFSAEIERLGSAPHRLVPARLSRPHTVLRARTALARLLQRESFDVVVCHQPWSCVLFASVIRAARLPVVLWVHMAGDGRHWLERLCRLTRPHMALCNSRFAAEATAQWLSLARIEHVYYPSSDSAHYSREGRNRIRADLQTAASDVVITQISRMEAWKGQRVLLTALGALRNVPGWMCWLVGGAQRPGETRYVAGLKALARSNGIEGQVRFLGERSDVRAILHAADLCCQPNTAPEPFGLSLVEALQSGLPVVTSGLGGALEIVDGSCGVLTAPNDVSRLSEALHRLVVDHDLRARLGSASRRRADDLCNAPRQIRRIEAVLKTALTLPQLEPSRQVQSDLV